MSRAFKAYAQSHGPDGFQLTFGNGWTASCSWADRVNYGNGENRAEVTRFKGNSGMKVLGWQSAEEVAAYFEATSKLCHCGGDMGRSDHCPECGCEEYERTCDHIVQQDPRYWDDD